MATTIHQPPQVEETRDRSQLNDAGGGGGRNTGLNSTSLRSVQDSAPPPASTAIWVLLASITMTFAALTSALIVRKGGAIDWRHFTLPSILYLNTLVLLASSTTLEIARRQVTSFMTGTKSATKPVLWLYATLVLGLLFVAGQYLAWRQLSAQGLYLATNPASSFFYVFTAAHAIHVLGGLTGLARVIHKVNRLSLRKSTLIATARYWHFMDVLWVYLLLLLWLKL